MAEAVDRDLARVQESGACKLQYEQFLHALMLIAEKRQAGFREVVTRVQRFGINRRASRAVRRS